MNPFNKSFKAHLDLEKNQRILFSGPFGIGKSYFLNDYFSTKENKETFEVFNIYPVNFHISNNEDVVKLIKYQIIKLLIEKGFVDFDNIENQNWFKAVKSLGLKNGDKFFKLFLKSALKSVVSIGLNKVGVSPEIIEQMKKEKTDLLEKMQKSFEELKEEKENIDSSIKEMKDFISETKSEWFAFDEDEFLTYFIRESLKNEKYKAKKKVLVIDDLDRLDPEHIFRILNIFSAFNKPHNHSQKVETDTNQENSVSESLFGFDKVILVADLHNLESVYHHKFGEKTDFQGYINKFYTSEPFFFYNNLEEELSLVLKGVAETRSEVVFRLYAEILIKLITFNHFTYRQFLKLKQRIKSGDTNITYIPKVFFQKPNHKNYSQILQFLTEFMIEIYDTKASLIRVIKKLKLEDLSVSLYLEFDNIFEDKIDSREVWENYFLKTLLINYYNKLGGSKFGKELNRHKYKIFGEDKLKYYDLEVPNDSDQINRRWNDNDPEFSSKMKNIHSFRDIWDLYLNYLEANPN